MKISGLIEPFQRAEGPPPTTLWAFMRWALSGSFPILIVAGVLSAVAGTLEVVTALVLGLVIDTALASDPARFFADNWVLLLVFAGFFVGVRPLFFGLSSAANSVVVQPNVTPLVLSRLNRWTIGQSVTFFDDDFAGRIAQKQMQTSRAITDVTSETINVVAFALASLIGSALLLTTIDWRVALVLAVWLIAYFWLIRFFLPKIRKLSASRAGARATLSGQIVDTITNVKTVFLFALSDHEDRAALGAMGTFRKRALDFGVMAAWFRLLLMTLAGALPILLIGSSLWLWSRGIASPGDIAAAGSISIRIAQMTGWVSFTLMSVYASIGEVEDGMRTLAPSVRLHDLPDAVDLPPSSAIEFDSVSFAYGRDVGGVEGITLKIAPGEKLGIVGASGAGKSTLVALLLRFYDPETGSISVGGYDIRKVTQDSLRRNIGMVTQETAMFNRSARDNILYGRPDATEAEILAAARKAEAHEFIQDLQDFAGRKGYDAYLGERGVKLSGGQRQRIALARAILKDAPILVLDEATSALDSEVEASIQAALDRVMEGKTVLAIAHRLSTISRMDRIVVLDQGLIAEEGTHKQLLSQGGLYAGYWNRQSGGFIGLNEAAE